MYVAQGASTGRFRIDLVQNEWGLGLAVGDSMSIG